MNNNQDYLIKIYVENFNFVDARSLLLFFNIKYTPNKLKSTNSLTIDKFVFDHVWNCLYLTFNEFLTLDTNIVLYQSRKINRFF